MFDDVTVAYKNESAKTRTRDSIAKTKVFKDHMFRGYFNNLLYLKENKKKKLSYWLHM